MWGEVAKRLAAVLNDDTFRSLEGKSKHQLWLELCDTVTRHPREVEGSGVDVEGVIRGGIRRFTDEVSHRAHFAEKTAWLLLEATVCISDPSAFFCLAVSLQLPFFPPSQVGRLWTSLADYYIRRAMFEKARDVYEEGLQSVVTVRRV